VLGTPAAARPSPAARRRRRRRPELLVACCCGGGVGVEGVYEVIHVHESAVYHDIVSCHWFNGLPMLLRFLDDDGCLLYHSFSSLSSSLLKCAYNVIQDNNYNTSGDNMNHIVLNYDSYCKGV
jgi:hypothetical protein